MKRVFDRTIWIILATMAPAYGCDDKAESHTNSGRVAIPGEEGEPPPVIGARDGSGAQGGEAPPNVEVGGGATVGAESLEGELASLYRSWEGEEGALLSEFPARLETALQKAQEFEALVRKVYQASGSTPVLTRGGELTEVGRAVLEVIKTVDSHGLDRAAYGVSELDEILAKVAQAETAAPPLADSDKALWDFVVSQRPSRGAPPVDLAQKAKAAGFSDGDLMRLSELRKRLNLIFASRKKLNDVVAELDVALVTRFHRFVYDMRFGKRAHPFLADKSVGAGLARVETEFVASMSGLDWKSLESFNATVAAVTPKFPDYEPTREALRRYRGYAAQYPTHIELPKEVDKLAAGRSGDLVKQLEERLIQEEYLTGAPTGKWGEALTAAVSAYQETHQMKPTGKMDKATRQSMNRTYAERLKQLELSLQRYRESDLHQGQFRFGEGPIRARVNIPSMEARFFLGTELARRHRVIVGNNDTETDAETGKRGKLNQTRLFTAEMQTVVLNPVWNVPKRIKEQELDQLLMDEPDYYEKHGFKVELNADGSERVVQQPGPGNALGLAKFLFPNPFSIYMHDTPKKALFDRPVRAFSHGCMRTHNPLDLARWILVEVDKEMTNEEFDAVLEAREERHFAIKPRIPISIDYTTTTIDEAGRINFLSDVYGFDKEFFEGRVPLAPDKDFPLTVIF